MRMQGSDRCGLACLFAGKLRRLKKPAHNDDFGWLTIALN